MYVKKTIFPLIERMFDRGLNSRKRSVFGFFLQKTTAIKLDEACSVLVP